MARLPKPGGDANDWGSILNEFLEVSHTQNGLLKDGSVTGAVVRDSSLTGSKLKDSTITESKLGSALLAKVNAGAGVTNLGRNISADSVGLTSSTGSGIAIPSATTSGAGVMSSTDKAKLNGIASNATANQTDANLLNRANHTGSQPVSSVSGLQSALDGKSTSSHTHSLGSLTDVSTNGASANQVLKYNGTSWAPATDDASGGGSGDTNLSVTRTGSNVTVNSDTGTDATIAAATTTDAGVMSASDKTKLSGIAENATANQSNAALLNRSNHTGAQAIATVTGLQSALDGKADSSHNHSAANITSGTITTARLGSGTASTSTYLRGDGTWATPSTGSSNPNVGGDLSGTASNAQIVAGAVGASELADSAVVEAKIANNAVTNSKITNGSVTEPKLAVANSPASDQLLSWDGSAMRWVAPPAGGGSTGFNIRQITTASVNAANNDWIVANPSAQAITVNLPAPAPNAHVRVKRKGLSGNSIMIATPNGGMLDGGEPTMATLNGGWASQDYESDGTDWYNV